MPIYQEVFTKDSFLRLQCPPQVSAYIEEHESYSVLGNDCKGEGDDFILEARNKLTKGLLPNGAPDEKQWINVCRNIDRLGKIRENINDVLGIKEYDGEYNYCRSKKHEIFQFRKIIRDRKYLQSENFQTLDGRNLDPELVNFSLLSEQNMIEHFDNIVKSYLLLQKIK
ncbi:hypothetical protein KUTeg_021872 [Tegillarca granosa]|uniref:Uncharacterized protein n=1 Tax=Tegillarca granosa TaxID=220873 RepID=A0ABQ9E4M5_TEGGR|nr:hypothetical protein KUTeg_021872 [Tegillarca granosa]